MTFNFKKHNKLAFTLAEVLIVIGIIGIVAEMTIPGLMQSFQKQVTLTKLKETYSVLNSAINMARVDYGTDMGQWTIQNASVQTAGASFAETYLLPYLKTSEVCGLSNDANCVYNYYKLNNPAVIADPFSGAAGYYTFRLINGVIVAVNFWTIGSTRLANDRFVLVIDVNGREKPNITGKDVFLIEPGGDFGGINKNKFVPYGHSISRTRECFITGVCEWDWSTISCNKSTGNGDFCFALIMADGWQIKDDYPW